MEKARAETDRLFAMLAPEALYARPVEDRHRLVFYLGHIDAFEWNLLARRGDAAPSFHPTFDALFARGIDPAPGMAPSDSPRDWPKLKEIHEYNLQVRQWLDEHLESLDAALLQMAVEHRYMHAETFAYLMHGLPYSWKQGPAPPAAVRPAPVTSWRDVAGGMVLLGQRADVFGWDNEFPRHEVRLNDFRITENKVSNGDYLHFLQETNAAPPHFWCLADGEWSWRGMFGLIPLPLDWPVWVTWSQARAYADWCGKRLPSEAQWMLAAQGTGTVNFDFQQFDPVAVDQARGMTGNGWDWTRDIFAPFEGFEPHPAYPGYSADFFDGAHYVLKGASPRTAALLARPSFRNWFRPDYPHMYAGFRLVEE